MNRALLPLATALALAGCASGDHRYRHAPPAYGDYAYEGEEWGSAGRWRGELAGPGTEVLDPWLIGTGEGRAIVTTGFRSAAQGLIDVDTAHRANIWFRRYADTDCDLRLTDAEIRLALVQASQEPRASLY